MVCAIVGGQLSLARSTITNPKRMALNAAGIRITGDIYLNAGFTAFGESNLSGAVIGGNLHCDGAKVTNPGRMALWAADLNIGGSVSLSESFTSQGEVQLNFSTIRGRLMCRNAHFNEPNGVAFGAEVVKVGQAAFLNSVTATGEVKIQGTTIGENLHLTGAILNGNARSVVALGAGGLDVQGSVFLRGGFRANGRVVLRGSSIQGNVECWDGRFVDPNGLASDSSALDLSGTNIGGTLMLSKGFSSAGMVSLAGAEIGGDLCCYGGTFKRPNGLAIYARGLDVHRDALLNNGFRAIGTVAMEGVKVEGAFVWSRVTAPSQVTLLLSHTSLNIIQDDRDSWPDQGKLHLEGLTYNQIVGLDKTNVNVRLEWLGRQPSDRHWPQGYEQLAKSFRSSGYDREAKMVLIQKNQDRAKYTMGSSDWIWYRLFGPMIAFGYGPLKVFYTGPFGIPFLGSIVFWVLLGWLVYRRGYHRGRISHRRTCNRSATTRESQRSSRRLCFIQPSHLLHRNICACGEAPYAGLLAAQSWTLPSVYVGTHRRRVGAHHSVRGRTHGDR